MRKKMTLLFVMLMSLLLTVAGSVAAQDEAGGTYEGTFAVSFPAGWELSEGNDFITLSRGASVINVYGPDAITNVVVDRMARTPEQLLAFFAERTGYTVGETIDEMSGAAAAVAVELPRRGLSGFAYLMDIGYQKSAVVYSLSSEAVDLALDEASSAVLDSISYRPTLYEIAAGSEDFSILTAAVDAAGLGAELARGPFTVFAPSNAAFEAAFSALGITAEELLADTDTLTSILLYHLVDGTVLSTDLVNGEVATLNGASVTINLDAGVKVNDATVVAADIVARNGVIHVIDSVLLPPAAEEAEAPAEEAEAPAEEAAATPAPNVVDVVAANDVFSTLVAAVTAADLVEAAATLEITVFAPTNKAFADLLATLNLSAEELLANTELLTAVLTYHVVPGRVFSGDLVAGEVATLMGEPVTISLDGGVFVNDARVLVADIEGSNGVVHMINKVLLPPSVVAALTAVPAPAEEVTPTIMGIVRSNPDFSLLNAAIRRAGLSNTLNQAGPLTVFAPNNAAIEATLAELGITADDLLADVAGLTVILRTHIVPGLVTAADVVGLDGQTVETLTGTPGGAPITISVRDGNVFINDTVQVVVTDIAAANGVIHVIDRVIVPPAEEVVEEEPEVVEPATPTIMGIVRSNPDFSLLNAAIRRAGLSNTLNQAGPLTVFAPNNAAIEATLAELGITADDLLADVAGLTVILRTHIVPGLVTAADVVGLDGQTVETLTGTPGGAPITISVRDGNVFINDTVQVVVTDIAAANGVIHVIDRVIVPPAEEVVEEPEPEVVAEPLGEVAMDGSFGSYLGYAFPTAWTQTVGNDFQRYDLEGNALVVFGSTSVRNVVPNLDELEPSALLSFFMERSGYEPADLVTLFPADFPGALARVNVDLPRRDQTGRAYLKQLSNGDKVIFVALGEGALEPAVNDAAKALGASLVYRPTLSEVAAGNADLSTLVAAVGASGLGSTLDAGNLTVFAPTNEAFAAALDALGVSAEALLGSGDLLTTILTYHAVPGQVFSTDLAAGEVATVQGDPVTINLSAGVQVNQANVVVADVVARDAVVHVIDAVLLPPSLCVVSASSAESTTVRVGPGNNRTPVAFLPTEGLFLVTGQAEANGVTWFRLISTAKAAPGKLINQAWVSSAQVSFGESCSEVPAVEPPPIIPG